MRNLTNNEVIESIYKIFLLLDIFLGRYIFPEINRFYDEHNTDLMRSIDYDLDLAIDGQCDSPGHNATYCTVSAMDLKTERIINFHVIDVKEVKNSQGSLYFFPNL